MDVRRLYGVKANSFRFTYRRETLHICYRIFFMNILFYTAFEVSPEKGGTERITLTIAEGMVKYYGLRCFSIYSTPIDACFPRPQIFLQSACIDPKRNRSDLGAFVTQNQIDVLVNQGAFGLTETFRKVIAAVRPACKIIFAHHFAPGSERHFVNFQAHVNAFVHGNRRWKNGLKCALYPIYKYMAYRRLPENYQSTYKYADCVVLLSRRFMPAFMSYGRLSESGKIREIHNSLSFDTFFDMTRYHEKKKTVLVVSRLQETQKKISHVLRIWEILEKDAGLQDWTLKIVGHGTYESQYKRFVKRHRLQRVSFEGIQNPEPYYEEASLFMMTSAWEGWGLTLTEAQQNGCIPLAYDSYASLADIITDGKNGYVIPYGDIPLYVKRMTRLMQDDALRYRMAMQAVTDSRRFEQRTIVAQWIRLIQELDEQK